MKNFMIVSMFMVASSAAFACGGNQCGDWGPPSNDWGDVYYTKYNDVTAGGYNIGEAGGHAAGNNDGTGTFVKRGALAASESGYDGDVGFGVSLCEEGCDANNLTVQGMGFTRNHAASYIQVEGPSASADTGTAGAVVGEGGAFSAIRKMMGD